MHVVVRRDSVEATVGGTTVALDLTDRRPRQERGDDRGVLPFREGVPVGLDGRQVAVVKSDPASPTGLFWRRARQQISGDPSFVLPGMRLTGRGLPTLLTLRSDADVMVSTRRWSAWWADLAWNYSLPGGTRGMAPRVTRDTRPEHVAFWFAMRETHR